MSERADHLSKLAHGISDVESLPNKPSRPPGVAWQTGCPERGQHPHCVRCGCCVLGDARPQFDRVLPTCRRCVGEQVDTDERETRSALSKIDRLFDVPRFTGALSEVVFWCPVHGTIQIDNKADGFDPTKPTCPQCWAPLQDVRD